MFASIRRHPVRSALGAVTVLAGLAWVAFGFFGVHTLFFDDVVSEAAPVFDSPLTSTEPAAEDPQPEAPLDAAPEAPLDAAPEAPLDAAPDTAGDLAVETTPASEPSAPEQVTEPPMTEQVTEPAVVVTELEGSFVSAAHPTSGTAVVLGNGTGQRFLRFEDFETDNGPDLNVYLRDPGTGEFVDLGDLKGNVGEQNYEIPADVDLERFSVVDIWCVRFGVGFGNARLSA
jgi:hypothetical protein